MGMHDADFSRMDLLVFCVAGIWSAHIAQGVLQVTLSTMRFGQNGRRFEHLSILTCAQRLVCLIWSLNLLHWSRSSSCGGASSLECCMATTFESATGLDALNHISYPAHVLGKSSKTIPVILMGTLVYSMKYTFPEHACALLFAGRCSFQDEVFLTFKSVFRTVAH
ncbi:UDP-galactose/UDP-glucose transporter 1-like [Papaver somniferum]|uniref:UDP-galactose/UDP-glucose transporter 1-like n=1 Tax=Papaver somniferum TaxID=3469 RepID=UPI000E7049E2|nr:UDP-galactose/UDP-glucose transporter 1-like [Papaver somniferum]